MGSESYLAVSGKTGPLKGEGSASVGERDFYKMLLLLFI